MSDSKRKILKYVGALIFVVAALFVVKTLKKNNIIQDETVGENQNQTLTIIDENDLASIDNDSIKIEDEPEVLEEIFADEFLAEIETDEEPLIADGPETFADLAVDIQNVISETVENLNQNQQIESVKKLDEKGNFYSKDDVALYIYTYKKLPKNFITKAQAEKLGWTPGVCLSDLADGKCIGGDKFYNREGVLPKKSGRTYTECDIGTIGKKNRGTKRIVFSNDGLIYYTSDHYEHFDLLYGEE